MTVGYASGVIPRIPLNLVLLKGVHVLGFQFQDVARRRVRRNEAELRELLATGRAAPHIGAVYPAGRNRARAAPGRRREGRRQGADRRQLAGMRSAATDGVAITPQRNVSVALTEPASGGGGQRLGS